MFNKLNKVLKRYHEINELLGEGSIYNDKALYTEITKEFASIKDLSETYMKYQKVNEEMKENKILLDDDDDDIREMAKEEMKELEEQNIL
jgi:peptide chain release factor 1